MPDEKAEPTGESPGTSQRRVELDSSDLDWPKVIADPDRHAAFHWLRQIPAEAQTVLDEVRYQHGIKPVVNPVAYVRALVQQVKALAFVPEGAAGIAAKRAEAKRRLEEWRSEEAARLAGPNAATDQTDREADRAAARRFFDAWRERRKPKPEQAIAVTTRNAEGASNAEQ